MRAWEQPQLAVRHHSFTGRDPALDDNLIIHGLANRNHARLYGLVRLHDKSELPLLSRLNRFGGDHGGMVQRPQCHDNINELARPKRVVAVRKSRFQLDGARGAIHRVIDKTELARGPDRLVGTIGNAGAADGERMFSAVAANFLQQLLGCAERYVHRLRVD